MHTFFARGRESECCIHKHFCLYWCVQCGAWMKMKSWVDSFLSCEFHETHNSIYVQCTIYIFYFSCDLFLLHSFTFHFWLTFALLFTLLLLCFVISAKKNLLCSRIEREEEIKEKKRKKKQANTHPHDLGDNSNPSREDHVRRFPFTSNMQQEKKTSSPFHRKPSTTSQQQQHQSNWTPLTVQTSSPFLNERSAETKVEG